MSQIIIAKNEKNIVSWLQSTNEELLFWLIL